MRDFSKVSPSLWRSSRFTNLSSDAVRLAFLYLLTSEHQTNAGAFRLPLGYAQVDLRWTAQQFMKARDELVQANLIEFDEATEEYRICGWFKHNAPMNSKHRIGIVSNLERLESDTIRENALAELETYCSGDCVAENSNHADPRPDGAHLLETNYLKRGRR